MSQPFPVKATHPAKDFNNITQVGLKALNLAAAHKEEIDIRLPGTSDALGKDLTTLGVAVPDAKLVRQESGAATVAQYSLLGLGYERVRAIRKTVRKAGAPRDVQRAYGVGQPTSKKVVRDVKSALQQIVDRATLVPAEAEGFGLVAADVTALKGFITGLAEAEMAQEKKRANAPLSTRARNLTANRILQAAALIAGTGMRIFAGQPAEHADFEALMTSTQRPKAKKTPKPPKPPQRQAAEAPVAKAEAPAAKAETPVAKAESPVAKAETPVAKAEAPVAKAEAPATNAEAPVTKREAPVAKVEAEVKTGAAPKAGSAAVTEAKATEAVSESATVAMPG